MFPPFPRPFLQIGVNKLIRIEKRVNDDKTASYKPSHLDLYHLQMYPDCVPNCETLANVSARIPVPNDQRQQEQGSIAKHQQVTHI